MKPKDPTPSDAQLSSLLRGARTSPSLPAHFQQNVWRRVEAADAPAAAGSWLDLVAVWILRPRYALAVAAVMLLAGILAGTWEGRQMAQHDAQLNYLASVMPHGGR
jgi:hypothetical protein